MATAGISARDKELLLHSFWLPEVMYGILKCLQIYKLVTKLRLSRCSDPKIWKIISFCPSLLYSGYLCYKILKNFPSVFLAISIRFSSPFTGLSGISPFGLDSWGWISTGPISKQEESWTNWSQTMIEVRLWTSLFAVRGGGCLQRTQFLVSFIASFPSRLSRCLTYVTATHLRLDKMSNLDRVYASRKLQGPDTLYKAKRRTRVWLLPGQVSGTRKNRNKRGDTFYTTLYMGSYG